jgi:hypothetical protein
MTLKRFGLLPAQAVHKSLRLHESILPVERPLERDLV